MHSTHNKFRGIGLGAAVLVMIMASSPAVQASPWAENEGYLAKTGGKLMFGLKHTLFSWLAPWPEAHDPRYATQWEGFCMGIGKIVIYTATGILQLATFPIPVDFPDIGEGLHIPEQ